MKYPNDEDLKKAFGARIKQLRKQYKFSQSELSALTNIDKGSLQRIERGYNPTLKTLRRLANAFEITLSELFEIESIIEKNSSE
jgi:transcriptional regulator with XRE-family HTH domain